MKRRRPQPFPRSLPQRPRGALERIEAGEPIEDVVREWAEFLDAHGYPERRQSPPCEVRGCSRRARREVLVPFLEPADGEPITLVPVCAAHEIALARGYVALLARTPGGLEWILGERQVAAWCASAGDRATVH